MLRRAYGNDSERGVFATERNGHHFLQSELRHAGARGDIVLFFQSNAAAIFAEYLANPRLLAGNFAVLRKIVARKAHRGANYQMARVTFAFDKPNKAMRAADAGDQVF